MPETWFNSCDDTDEGRFKTACKGFHILHNPQEGRRGGGIAAVSRSCCTLNKTSSLRTFKMLDVGVLLLLDVLRLVAIHRSPYNLPSCRWTVSDFISEFPSYLESLAYDNGRLIIVGDFNIHVDDHDDNVVKKLLDLLNSLGLTQHVIYPTHNKGHTLCPFITRAEGTCMTGIEYDWLLPSDYCSIYLATTFTNPRYETVVRSSRKIRHTNINVLASMIESVLPAMDLLGSDVSRLVEEYNMMKMKVVIILKLHHL